MNRFTGDYVLTAQELALISGGADVGRCITYTVVKGDSLAKIAHTYGVDAQVIGDLNHLGSDKRIFVGQVLLIPFNPQ